MGATCCTNNCKHAPDDSNNPLSPDAKVSSAHPAPKVAPVPKEKSAKKNFRAVPVTSSSASAPKCPPIPIFDQQPATTGHVHAIAMFTTNQGKMADRSGTGWRSSGTTNTSRRYASPGIEKDRGTPTPTTTCKSQLTRTKPSPYQ